MTSPDKALENLRKAVEAATSVGLDATASTDLAVREDADSVKKRLAAAHSSVSHAVAAAQEQASEARALIEAKRRELLNMEQALSAQLAPLMKQVARLQDGIAAVNLYVGTDEQLEELRDGQSAPAETPIHLRQMVLHMDEESVLYTDGNSAPFDWQDIRSFYDWLLAAPENLDQVMPEPKSIVTLTPRRRPLDYKTNNPVLETELNRKNFDTTWLIRNGERLYALQVPFNVGTQLIPPRDAFTKLFENAGSPGSFEWRRAEEAADLQTRHYMKIALVLQGLVDRTAVLHPFVDGPVDFLSDRDYDAGRIVLIADDEFALTDGRPDYFTWVKAARKKLDVGQRVVGWWPLSEGSVASNVRSTPETGVPHVIAGRRGHDLTILFERTEEVDKGYDSWGRWRGYGKPEKRASYRFDPDAPIYIPMDTVTLPEIDYYLSSRSNRREYMTMLPTLRAARAALLAEREAEAPFRDLLAQNLEREGVENVDIDELIRWYKLANKWYRPLVGTKEQEMKAGIAIIREAHRRQREVISERALELILREHDEPLVVARRKNDIIVLEAEPREYAVATPRVYVRRTIYTLGGQHVGHARWKTVRRSTVSTWTIIQASEEWESWELDPPLGRTLPDPAIAALIETVKAHAERRAPGLPILMIQYEEPKLKPSWPTMPSVTIVWASRASDDSRGNLEQPYSRQAVIVKAGVGTLEYDEKSTDELRRWRLNTYDWRIQRPWSGDRRAPRPEPHFKTGDALFVDREVEKADAALAGAWFDRKMREEKADARRSALWQGLREDWRRHETELRRQRFLADFGDETLWPAHAKTQKSIPFPEALEFSGWSKPPSARVLGELIEAIERNDMAVAGLTVAEAAAALNYDATLLSDISMLRLPEFPTDESENL